MLQRVTTHRQSVAVSLCRGSLNKQLYAGLHFTFTSIKIFKFEGKVKAVPLQAWSGPEGSTKLRFPDYMTTVQNGGKFVSLTHRPLLPPRNTPGILFC